MSKVTKSLEDLKDVVEGKVATLPVDSDTENVSEIVEPKIDKHGRAYATGKRKNAIARVWLKPGSGKIMVKLL